MDIINTTPYRVLNHAILRKKDSQRMLEKQGYPKICKQLDGDIKQLEIAIEILKENKKRFK